MAEHLPLAEALKLRGGHLVVISMHTTRTTQQTNKALFDPTAAGSGVTSSVWRREETGPTTTKKSANMNKMWFGIAEQQNVFLTFLHPDTKNTAPYANASTSAGGGGAGVGVTARKRRGVSSSGLQNMMRSDGAEIRDERAGDAPI